MGRYVIFDSPMHGRQMTFKKQELKITSGWTVNRYEFYDVDPADDVPIEEKEVHIFCQEDMLWITKGSYTLDLGWYGGDRSKAGYCIFLFRGSSWNTCDLLEIFRSKCKDEITEKINAFIQLVDNQTYDDLRGYRIDENDAGNTNSMTDYETYSALKQP
jgi:hypothetical protein